SKRNQIEWKNWINDEGIWALGNLKFIQVFILELKNEITDEGLKHLGKSWNQSLIQFKLSRNSLISSQGVLNFGLETNKLLKSFSLTNCKIDSECLSYIFQTLTQL